jgi:thymidylate synthase (FAD)
MAPFRREVLDHGYIELVESWGSEESIIAAARMSTGKGFLGWGPKCSLGFHVDSKQCDDATRMSVPGHEHLPGDEKLLRYLWENKHATPFEMAGVTIEVQAPIFVFREWHRHRVPFSYNEMSARYTPLPDVNYIPTVERLMINSKTNKQAATIKGASELSNIYAEGFQLSLRKSYEDAEKLYQDALAHGVPKELARIHLPVGRYSRMRASANLRGWLAFITLRSAPSAQWEIRQYSDQVGKIIEALFPRTWQLFQEKKA